MRDFKSSNWPCSAELLSTNRLDDERIKPGVLNLCVLGAGIDKNRSYRHDLSSPHNGMCKLDCIKQVRNYSNGRVLTRRNMGHKDAASM